MIRSAHLAVPLFCISQYAEIWHIWALNLTSRLNILVGMPRLSILWDVAYPEVGLSDVLHLTICWDAAYLGTQSNLWMCHISLYAETQHIWALNLTFGCDASHHMLRHGISGHSIQPLDVPRLTICWDVAYLGTQSNLWMCRVSPYAEMRHI